MTADQLPVIKHHPKDLTQDEQNPLSVVFRLVIIKRLICIYRMHDDELHRTDKQIKGISFCFTVTYKPRHQ